jgi:hypothetical protein
MFNRTRMLDAQQGLAYLIPQTTYIEKEVYKVKYPAIMYPFLVPVDTSAPEWIKTITYIAVDITGAAKWINGGGRDIPLAELNRSKGETTVEMAGLGYGFNLEEISQAAMLGMNLSSDKAQGAREIAELTIDNIAIVGDTTKGFQGLINNSSVNHAAVAAGASTHTNWETKTPDEILFDVNDALTNVNSVSNTIEMANTLLLPNTSLQLIAGKRIDPNGLATVLSFLKEHNVYTQTTGNELVIRGVRQLETAGVSGDSSKRMMVYDRSPQVVKMHLPMPFKFLPIWQDGPMSWLVPGIFRVGGTDFRRPGAARYRDGI